MRNKLVLILIMVFTLITATADEPASFYQAQVPIASQSQADWQTGVSQALAQVLVKMSGSDKILTKPAIKKALSEASSYVNSYSYLPASEGNTLTLQVQFYGQTIESLLQSAGVSTMPKQYPSMLTCFAIQSNQGKNIIANNDALAATLKNDAQANNISIILPMMDLQDMQTLNVDTVWQLNADALAAVAARYGAQAILTGKLYSNANQQWQGDWVLLSNKKTLKGQVQGADPNQVIALIFNKIVATLAAHAPVTTEKSTPTQLVLSISNINNIDDFAKILNYLRKMPQVNSADTANINANALVINVNINSRPEDFVASLNTSGLVTAIPNEENNNTLLTYRWSGADSNALTTTTAQSDLTTNNDDHGNSSL